MNSSERRLIESALRRAGFTVSDETRHTTVWTRDGIEFRMPRNRGTHDPRNARDQRAALRRMGVEL
jgi:hypothetical protein